VRDEQPKATKIHKFLADLGARIASRFCYLASRHAISWRNELIWLAVAYIHNCSHFASGAAVCAANKTLLKRVCATCPAAVNFIFYQRRESALRFSSSEFLLFSQPHIMYHNNQQSPARARARAVTPHPMQRD